MISGGTLSLSGQYNVSNVSLTHGHIESNLSDQTSRSVGLMNTKSNGSRVDISKASSLSLYNPTSLQAYNAQSTIFGHPLNAGHSVLQSSLGLKKVGYETKSPFRLN